MSLLSRLPALYLCAAFALAADPVQDLDHARALHQSGKLAEAKAAYQQLLSTPSLQGEAHYQLSRIALAEGRYPDALAEAAGAASIARGHQDRNLEGNALNVSGMTHSYLGDYAAALSDFAVALDAARKSADAASEVTRLNNIGNVLYYQGRYADAMQHYQDALKIVDRHRSDSWNPARRQLTIANIAILEQRLGRYRNALATYASMNSASNALPPVERAQLLSNMGALYRRLGDAVKALETYHAAQAIYRENRMRSGEITVLNNIGIAQALDLHALPDALGSFGDALTMAKASASKPLELQALLYRGETLLRLNRPADAARDFQSALSLADAVQAPEDKWKALYGLARTGKPDDARTYLRDAVRVIESIRSNTGTSAPRNTFLADKRQVYDLLIDIDLRAAHPDAAELFRLMEQSRARSLKDRKGSAVARDLSSLSRSLGPGTRLVEYWVGEDAVAAVWVDAKGSGVFARTGVPWLRRDALQLAKALAGRRDDWRAIADRIGPLVREPLQGATRFIVVPDRELTRIPFELFAGWAAVAYLPTASLLRTAEPNRRRGIVPFWAPVMLAFADPAPGTGSESIGIANPPRLAGAAVEVDEIRRELGRLTAIHTGADARKQYLADVSRYPLLHLATHAFIDAEDASRSYILFAPARSSQVYDYLFLKEVSTLDLKNVDLVTASACDTQNGEFVDGEGLDNFSQAFLSSGARAVVSSLWRVDDRATASLMRAFYAELAVGWSGAEALAAAKHSIDSSHPFYWAAFILSGDADLRLPYVISWTVCLAALLGLVGLVLIVFARRRSA